VAGPVLGGFVGGHIGMRAVFLGTAVLLVAGAAYAWMVRPRMIEAGSGSAARAAADQLDA
jgi:predicted MFS family arabinose efflux permease